MRIYPTLYLLFFILGITACQTNELEEALLLGKWQGAEWTVEGNKNARDATVVHFEFRKDGYTAHLGQQKEEGSYHLSGNKLYTTETGKAQKMVEISTLTADSLVMKMNRVGTLETLVLLKK